MFWNDIKEIKEWMDRLTDRIIRIYHNVEKLVGYHQQTREMSGILSAIPSAIEMHSLNVKKSIEEAFSSEDEFSSINRIHDKLNTLIEDLDRKEAVELAIKTLDKFEKYMENVDKLNAMINEFKGCISMARDAIAERKELDAEFQEMKKVSSIAKDIYNSMLSFIKSADNFEQRNYFKLDAIYKEICEKTAKKPKNKGKTVKKTVIIHSP